MSGCLDRGSNSAVPSRPENHTSLPLALAHAHSLVCWLRAIDVFEHDYVPVNGCWITPRRQAGFRGPVKNHSLHEVPLPKSLMRDELLPRVKVLLGLPAKASLQQVVSAQEAERQRRASLATPETDRNLAWWNHPVSPEDELWLFVDTVTDPP